MIELNKDLKQGNYLKQQYNYITNVNHYIKPPQADIE